MVVFFVMILLGCLYGVIGWMIEPSTPRRRK